MVVATPLLQPILDGQKSECLAISEDGSNGGLISPRASSMVERVMRELGRRLKKTAYNWSDKGVTKIARIILKRFTNAKAW